MSSPPYFLNLVRYRREDVAKVVIIYDNLRIVRENLCQSEKHPFRKARFMVSKRFLFLAWQGAGGCGLGSRAIHLRSILLRSIFSKIFKGLQKNFHFDEKSFSTKRKFSLDIPKL